MVGSYIGGPMKCAFCGTPWTGRADAKDRGVDEPCGETPKFKVGDRVKAEVPGYPVFSGVLVGRAYWGISAGVDVSGKYVISNPHTGQLRYYDPSFVTADATDGIIDDSCPLKPKFSVGDAVKVRGGDGSPFRGFVGHVSRAESCGSYRYGIINHETQARDIFHEDWVTKDDEPDEPTGSTNRGNKACPEPRHPKFRLGEPVFAGGMIATVEGINVRPESKATYTVKYAYSGYVEYDLSESDLKPCPWVTKPSLALFEEALDISEDILGAIDRLKPTRYAETLAPTLPRLVFNGQALAVEIDGEWSGYSIKISTFLRMKQGVEYMTDDGAIVVRRHGDALIARKLETFTTLSELDEQ